MKNVPNCPFPKHFPCLSTKTSDDLLLAIYSKFVLSLYFRLSHIFLEFIQFPLFWKNLICPIFFLHFSLFSFNLHVFGLIYVFLASPILTMMHLCIMQYMYWTPLGLRSCHDHVMPHFLTFLYHKYVTHLIKMSCMLQITFLEKQQNMIKSHSLLIFNFY